MGHEASPMEVCSMVDPELWRCLPRDVLHRLLRHLPLPCLLRSRSVCREWYQFLSSDLFLVSRSLLPSPPPDDLCLALFSPTHPSPSFSFISPSSRTWSTICLSRFLPFPSLHLLSCSPSGLLCLRATIDSSLLLIVCNPITGSLRVLPPLLRRRLVPVVSLVPHPDSSSGFSVVVCGDDFTHTTAGPSVADLSSEVYDSVSDRWFLTAPIPRGFELDFGTAFLDGNLYVPTCRPPEEALCFNVRERVWSKVRADMPPGVVCPRFAESAGRVFMVAGFCNVGGRVEGIGVWVLSAGDGVWRKFARMKKGVFQRFFEAETDNLELNFRVVGHATTICLIIYERVDMVAIDVKTRKWVWLPGHPSSGAGPSSSSSPAVEFFGCPFSPMLQTVID
ncbi:unnamed protein product [Victoria cruziana]